MEEPKYKENNNGYQFSRHSIIQNLELLIYDTPHCFAYISAFRYRKEMVLYSRQSYGSNLSNAKCASLLACFLPEKLSKNQSGAFFLGHPVYRIIRSIQDHTGLCTTLQDYTGLYRTIQDYIGLYRTLQD